MPLKSLRIRLVGLARRVRPDRFAESGAPSFRASDGNDVGFKLGPSGELAQTLKRFAYALLFAALFAGVGLIALRNAPPAGAADTYPGQGLLPDDRVWELVSPGGSAKQGADVLIDSTKTISSTDGEAILYGSLAGFGDVRNVPVRAEYVAERTEDGWKTHAVTPPQEPLTLVQSAGFLGAGPDFIGLSDDLDTAIVRYVKTPLGDSPDPSDPAINSYLRTDLLSAGPGSYHLVSGAVSPQASSDADIPNVAAHSADYSKIIFESKRNLTQQAIDAGLSTSKTKLYEWASGELRLVGILPASEGGGLAATSFAGHGTTTYGNGATAKHDGGSSSRTERTISADGSRVIFTVPPASYAGLSCTHSACGNLYVRDDAGTPEPGDDTTVRINASERTDCSGPQTDCDDDGLPELAQFGYASTGVDSDGHREPLKVFFTTTEPLIDSDNDALNDLYVWDMGAPEGSRLTKVSVDNDPSDGTGQGVVHSGVIGASESGDYVYFLDTRTLVSGQQSFPQGLYIYVWHDGVVRLVGVKDPRGNGQDLDFLGYAREKTQARVTADGTALAFIATGPPYDTIGTPAYDQALTGYDQHSNCQDPGNDRQCDEAYVYLATANNGQGKLLCASCQPSGAPAKWEASFDNRLETATAQGSPLDESNPLTSDGRYVFFTSEEDLLPDDENGVADVYVFDTESEQVHLLSSGRGENPSYFMTATPDGSSVFFVTRDQLSAWDVDNLQDLYVARVDGGLPEPAAEDPPCTSNEACKPDPTDAPAAEEPGSNAEGSGNSTDQLQAACSSEKRALARAKQGKRRAGKKAKRLHRRATRKRSGNRRQSRTLNRRARRIRQKTKSAVRSARSDLRSCWGASS